jgi:hypothetical protein
MWMRQKDWVGSGWNLVVGFCQQSDEAWVSVKARTVSFT